MNNGFFDKAFDFNHDGELDGFERAMQFEAFEEMTKDDVSGDSVDIDEMEDIELAGLDYDELSDMDEEERNEMLEDAGLDPDDYDF